MAKATKVPKAKLFKETVKSPPRERIIWAAHECLKTRGYALTTVKDIAKVAKVNHAMIHYYFGSLENLYVALIAAQVQKIESSLGEQASFEQHRGVFMNAVKEGRVLMELVAMSASMPKVAKAMRAHQTERFLRVKKMLPFLDDSGAWYMEALFSGMVFLYNIDPKVPLHLIMEKIEPTLRQFAGKDRQTAEL